MIDSVWHDLRFAARSLAHARGFTAAVVLTMALGIGANAVVFSVVKAVVINPLPYGNPERLVTIVEADGHTGNSATVSFSTVRDWRVRSQSFDHLSLWTDFGVRLLEGGRADMVRGMRVNADFFDTLGVPMYLGRSFKPEEDTAGGRNVLVLTYGLWMERFGGDPAVVGRFLPALEGGYAVIGVLPPHFQPLHMSNPAELPRVFAPLGYDDTEGDCRTCRGLRAIGALKPGVTSGEAEAELATIMRALVREHPADYPSDAFAAVTPLRDQLIGHFGTALWMLQGAVGLLLLLACANVATLLLARATARRTEVAVRAALGAGRGRLVRQMLTESVLLAATGGLVGVCASWWAIGIIARRGGTMIPRIGELAPDRSLLVFGLAASAVTGVVFGLAPAVAAWRGSLADRLHGAQTSTSRPSHHTAVRVLVATEIALAFVLLLAVGLLGKSYLRLIGVDLGYDPQHVLTLSLLPAGPGYGARHVAYFDAISDRMQTIPGVESAGYASTLPLSHASTTQVRIREHPLALDADAPNLNLYLVSADYFHVVRMPVIRGRGFTPQDSPEAPPVAIISESTARAQFHAENPIGKHIKIGAANERRPWAAIVGVVGDVRQYGLEQRPNAAIYLPFSQTADLQGWASLVVRSTMAPERIESAVRAAMVAVDPLQPIFHLQPMTTYISLSIAQRTFTLTLIAIFGGLALLLASVGIYGVVSYVVGMRTREVGLRLALGATPGAVRWLILQQILVVAIFGVASGYVLAAVCTRVLSQWLFRVERLDEPTAVGVAAILVLVALAASYKPVARAGRVDPQVTLRGE
ncbi:MAG TPA: ABC transporter permease [Vicinamibacterales bacterium]|nr:ABC transporter permease [Vicinamibacterales bacterium]